MQDSFNFLIIGQPSSGKTYLSKLFSKTHMIIHTDDYIKYGYEDALDKIISDIKGKKNTVVEGVQGYRLLRHGLKTGSYLPDVVIEVENKNIKYPADKLDKMISFNKGNQSILDEYKAMDNPNKPIWLNVRNNYAGNI